jgi:bifunctional non-homologous end joining protein LigD
MRASNNIDDNNKIVSISYNNNKKDSCEFPTAIKPMLATLIDQPFDNKDWVFEVKWDGVRAILFLHKTKGILKIVSRKGKTITHRYPEFTESVNHVINCKESIILDGEIVLLNNKGQPDFQSHQRRMNLDSIKDIENLSNKMPATYYLFDILHLDSRNLQPLSFIERRKKLSDAISIKDDSRIRISDFFEEDGIEFFRRLRSLNLEGVVAKNKYSKYLQGTRSTDWLKINNILTQDCVVIGYTRGEGSREGYFGSLLLAIYTERQQNELTFVGHTGSGFDFAQLNDIYSKFQQMKIEQCPAKFIPYTNREVTWVSPQFVAEVKFSGWTKEKIMRSPIFLRFKEDKKPEECIMEEESHAEQFIEPEHYHHHNDNNNNNNSNHHASITNTTTSSLVTNPKIPNNNADFKKGVSKNLLLSNLDKIYWPKTSEHPELTKGDLIEYYSKIADYILPYVKDRPLSLSRYPDGIAGKHFFHKNWGDKERPGFIDTVQVYSKSARNINNLVVCNNKDALLWIASLGCIEIHPWHSRVKDYDACNNIATVDYSSSSSVSGGGDLLGKEKCGLNYPDFIVFDLDPYIYGEKKGDQERKIGKNKDEPEYSVNSFKATVEVAYSVKDLFDTLNIKSYIKTSGKTGLHIFFPIKNTYSFDQTRRFAETIGKMLVRRYPQKVTMEWDTIKRKGKVFFDHNQNSIGKTIASVFSARPTIPATVSMPVKWEDLGSVLPTDFTLLNVFEVIKKSESIWRDILEQKQDLGKILGK